VKPSIFHTESRILENMPFPAGGRVTVEISWAGVEAKVYQPIVVNRQLNVEDELVEDKYSQAPLVSGYTWFHVYEAVDSSGASVDVLNPTDAQLFPYQKLQVSPSSITYFRQPAHAVRAKTHEEKYALWGLLGAAGSLATVAVFQIIDWALRFFLKL
jgi:hypothetical protein